MRLSVFGVSYFTLGPQVGGEPLQVLYLQRNHGLTFARATSAVIMDKLLEFLVNFLLLGVGAWAVVRVGLLSESGTSLTLSLIGLAGVLTWPPVHILLLVRGKYPIAALLRRQRAQVAQLAERARGVLQRGVHAGDGQTARSVGRLDQPGLVFDAAEEIRRLDRHGRRVPDPRKGGGIGHPRGQDREFQKRNARGGEVGPDDLPVVGMDRPGEEDLLLPRACQGETDGGPAVLRSDPDHQL